MDCGLRSRELLICDPFAEHIESSFFGGADTASSVSRQSGLLLLVLCMRAVVDA
jgi:hypothetical protein